MAVGFICGKVKLITPEVNRGLSNLALMLVNPMTTFSSYQTAYSGEIAINLLFTFILEDCLEKDNPVRDKQQLST